MIEKKPAFPKFDVATETSLNGLKIPCYRIDAEHAREFVEEIIGAQESDRIELKALSACQGKKLLFVLSFAPGSLVHVELDCSKLGPIPSLRSIWPIASWWEDELERAGEFSFQSEFRIEGVKWPQ